jgi:hypothetical protein
MRVYVTVTVPQTEAIFQSGWADLYTFEHEPHPRGVYVSTQPLGANDGFLGEVTLCLDVPEEVFAEYDCTDEVNLNDGYRMAFIPAAALNAIGRPQVYDHRFAGISRRQLLQSIRQWEEAGPEYHPSAEDLRRAFDFFDRIGWLTPLKVQEEGEGLWSDHSE